MRGSDRILHLAVALLFLIAFAGVATADEIIVINSPNTALSGYTGPYATATVHLNDATHALVTFDYIFNGTYNYLMGDSGAADLNVNATSFSIVGGLAGITEIPNFAPTSPETIGSGNVDGFGTFNLTIDNFDGFTYASKSISFTLVNLSGTWSSAANVLKANDHGAEAAVHTYVALPGATSALVTGFAAGNGDGGHIESTPEPITTLLTGAGLVALGIGFRRRTHKIH